MKFVLPSGRVMRFRMPKMPQILPRAYRVLEVRMQDGEATYYPQERQYYFFWFTMCRPNGTIVSCNSREDATNHITTVVKNRRRNTVAKKTKHPFNEVFEKLKEK